MIISEKPIIIFDLETTGVNINTDRVVQIAMLKLFPDGKVEEKSKLLNPTIPIPKEASDIHHITDNDVKDCPTFKIVSRSILNFIEDCNLIGFNILRFDLPLLEKEFARVGIKYDCDLVIIDVMSLYHHYNPRDLSAAYKQYCGEDLEGAHDALIDVKATLMILVAMIKKYELNSDVENIEKVYLDTNMIDREGKFIFKGDEPHFNFGKYKGEKTKNHRDYLNWMLGNDFSDHVKNIIRNSL